MNETQQMQPDNYVKSMWEGAISTKTEQKTKKSRVIQEIMHDSAPHNFRKQSELHEVIRNEEDYDDWD